MTSLVLRTQSVSAVFCSAVFLQLAKCLTALRVARKVNGFNKQTHLNGKHQRFIFTAPRVCIARICRAWQDVCLSVCLSHAGIVPKRLHISSKFFSPSGSPTILVFPHRTGWQYSDGNPLTGASNARGYDKMTIFSQISRSISETVS